MPTSTARNYFEDFTGEGAVAKLQAMPSANPKVFEGDWLDFKEGKVAENRNDLEKVWSKALGAFANNEGGVIVFGLRAKEDKETKIDAVDAVETVKDVNKLVSDLKDLGRFNTDPPVSGIEYVALPLNAETAEGFVVCYIPEGNAKPYQSLKAGKQYYFRVGDSSRDMPRSVLANLFYPKRSLRMEVELKVHKPKYGFRLTDELDNELFSLLAQVWIRNIGEFSLEQPLVRIESECYWQIEWQDLKVDQFHPDFDTLLAVRPLGDVLHPRLAQRFNVGFLFKEKTGACDVTLIMYARDMAPKRITLRFEGSDIVAEFI